MGYLSLWMLYLSLVLFEPPFFKKKENRGTEGFDTEFDKLLMEIGFLGIFYAPLLVSYNKTHSHLDLIIQNLMKFMLFRILFVSAAAKLLG
jgi:hypothetical protein